MPNKRGLCWPVQTLDALFPFTRPGSKVSWLYNWSPSPHHPELPGNNNSSSSSLEWVPMQWNGVGADGLADKCASASAAVVLGFNEPERDDQANMSPEEAADVWVTYVEPLRRRRHHNHHHHSTSSSGSGGNGDGNGRTIRAGSPGISSCEAGIAWLQRFTALVRARGSDVDFWCLHWYGGADLGAFYDFIWSAHARLGHERPVWITEFACTSWDVANPVERRRVEDFCRDSCRYLDTLDWVERYAWFGPMRDTGAVGRWAALLDENGGISELGKVYRDA